MRTHILREISKNKLDPKKAHVLNRGKLIEQKKKQTASVLSDQLAVETRTDTSTTVVEIELPRQEEVTLSQEAIDVVPEEVVTVAPVEVVTGQVLEEVNLTTESVVEDKKKKSNFFKKKQSLVQ